MLLLFTLLLFIAKAQDTSSVYQPQDSISQQRDLIDLFKKIVHAKQQPDTVKKSTLTILPALGYNPSIGFLLGINFLKSFYTGNRATTNLSVAQLDGSYTTKNLVQVRFRTNIFTNNNTWNLQGNWQYLRNYINDYGLADEAEQKPPVNYPIRFNYFRFTEKAFRNLGNGFYAGGGISIDMRNHVNDEKLDSVTSTPHYRYSLDKGYNPERYNVNGLIALFQYNTKDHPNRPYKGMYAEVDIRYNAKFLGSTKEATQLYTELRKYWGLSAKNPEHVIAVWYWGSYLLGGSLPYLELPGTAYDTYNRSGRGYTLSRFKGPGFVYGEAEYRFPISQVTKFLSGVVFTNFQSYADASNKGLFQSIEPSVGAGIRILFTKHSRTNICLDYAHGKYGSSGFFFALNEAF